MYAAGIPILAAHDDCHQTEWPLKMPTLLSQSHRLGETKRELPGKGQLHIKQRHQINTSIYLMPPVQKSTLILRFRQLSGGQKCGKSSHSTVISKSIFLTLDIALPKF